MTTRYKLKIIATLACLLCISACVALFQMASKSISLEIKRSSMSVAQLQTASRIYNYLQNSDKAAITDKNMVLGDLMLDRNNHPRNPINSTEYNQIKSDLALHKQPDDVLVNKWLSGVLYNTIVDQNNAYMASLDNMAPAYVLVNPSALSLLLIIIFSAIIAAFNAGKIHVGVRK